MAAEHLEEAQEQKGQELGNMLKMSRITTVCDLGEMCVTLPLSLERLCCSQV
jgi:hypothetical protein